MSTINDSISRIRSLLLNPKTAKPSMDTLFTNLTYEFQNFYNELSTSNLPWTYNEQIVNVTSGQTDYLLVNPTGKVLFVIAYPQNTAFGPVSLEFADLASISSDFFLFSPLDSGFSPDFNEAINFPFPFDIAFYRKDNDLWFRLPPFAYALTSIKVVYSTGDWLSNLQTTDTAVLSAHHALPEVRSALNLLAASEWVDESIMVVNGRKTIGSANQQQRNNLERGLLRQEAMYARQFMYAKREMTADQTSERVAYGSNRW